MRTRTRARARTRTRERTRERTRTRTRTRARVRARTRAHARTHAHTICVRQAQRFRNEYVTMETMKKNARQKVKNQLSQLLFSRAVKLRFDEDASQELERTQRCALFPLQVTRHGKLEPLDLVG